MSGPWGIYVFCAIPEVQPQQLGSVKLDSAERQLYTILYRDIAMVAAKVPLKIYPPKREYVLAHEQVVSDIMKQFTVIPMSFGNVLQTEADVLILLKKLYPQFASIFPSLANKLEVGLKVIGKKEWLEREIKQDGDIQQAAKEIAGKSHAAAFYDRVKLGELAVQFIAMKRQQLTEEVYMPLAQLAVSAKLNEAVNERMLLNAAFLIDKADESKFDEQVNVLYEKWKDTADFKYTGPWPPYNFINIKLKIEEQP
ncbi:GvpL/GvpF family gas vesicle protein [Paenibacillus montanisoli]|uniref:Gas vesicle protein GvpF n=1 Tax=Paenibacillus montanisoli TaxID=2081970 RepID=A0A328U580_9BACL|nr:GvpL/GvpF family gas vesicle protein [Paenibacillus montanisoli]RAP75184.1 gas vesicle protein GvpF [Paenibacillus montanisoli]